MTEGLKSYPAYKSSGVPWVGEMPEHWSTERAKWLFLRMERPVRPQDKVVTCFRDGMVTLRKNRRVRGFTEALKEIGYQGIRRGDLVIHAMDGFAGAIGVADSDGKGSPVYSVCTPRSGVDAYYYSYALREMARSGWILALATGIRERSTDFRFSDFGAQRVPFPPPEDQSAIVRYLDHVDRRIRKYIRAKQKLIGLLNEQKQALIHNAVTRGLDPNVRFKPSGVPWLGDVPEHWVQRRFKFVARVANGQVDPRDPVHRDKILIAPNHVEKETGSMLFRETAAEQGAMSGKYIVRPGQVVYCKIRPYLRKATIAADECLCSADMYPISVRESEIRSQYFLQLILSVPFTKQAVDCSLRAAMPKVNREALGLCWLWYPELVEQDAILNHIKLAIAPIDAALDRARRGMDLLREYRTRLVADVVTGKLDVREAAANLPEEAEEGEAPEVEAPEDLEEANEEALGSQDAEDHG